MNNEVMELGKKECFSFGDLVKIMEALRSPEGCPWDREQTHESLKRYLIEEAYETLEAIDAGDDALLCEELGDVLLQIVFHADMSPLFSIGDVINGVCKKMVSRHPHVFGTVVAKTSGEVLKNWEQIKREEKGISGHSSMLRRVPANLPALMRAYKVQQKARDAGFDWDSAEPVFDKVAEEFAELRDAAETQKSAATVAAQKSAATVAPQKNAGTVASQKNAATVASQKNAGTVASQKNAATVAPQKNADIADELGDLLFAAVNLSRFLKVHPELALTAATEKFIRRFDAMEAMITGEGRQLAGMALNEMDTYWEKVKKAETNSTETNVGAPTTQ